MAMAFPNLRRRETAHSLQPMESSSAIQTAPGGAGASAGSGPSAPLGSGGRFSSNRNVAVVQADYLALANDLEQAQALTSTLEIQLSGKTNELARIKVIWEKTQSDLVKFAADLDTMRKERHSLANEVQRGYAFEHRLTKLQEAHDTLTARAERLEAELMRERAGHVETRAELEKLREKSTGLPHGAGAGNLRDPELRQTLETLRTQLDRVLGAPAGAGPSHRGLKTAASERIDIEFGG